MEIIQDLRRKTMVVTGATSGITCGGAGAGPARLWELSERPCGVGASA